jgi:hypothetical protein
MEYVALGAVIAVGLNVKQRAVLLVKITESLISTTTTIGSLSGSL